MKKTILKSFIAVVIGALFFTSCEDKNNDDIITSELITADETSALIESDDISYEVENIIDETILEGFSVASKDEASKDDSNNKKGRPDCVEKTVVKDGLTRTITLDFGDGCEMKNGHVLSGKITIVVTLDFDAKTKFITHTYEEGFMVDDVSVSGESTITRIKMNDNGNPEMTVEFNKTLSWPEPDGGTITRDGIKTREWIEGYNNNGWGDNVHLISGTWDTKFKDGSTYSAFISKDTPLRREFSCKYIVSGIKSIVKDDKEASIDFGDGSCDNVAIYSDENGDKEITLNKRKRNK